MRKPPPPTAANARQIEIPERPPKLAQSPLKEAILAIQKTRFPVYV
jgi:hypothetical protein